MKTKWGEIRWRNLLFLSSTLFLTLTATPLYIWYYGLDLFQIGLFFFFFLSSGFSITLGYHRLFSHLTFHASKPIKLYTLIFGASAFEGSAMEWSADHRRHHKHVDHDEDPYDINKGLFWAHIGWLLFRNGPDTPLTWVRDLQKDKLAVWQHRHYIPLAVGVGLFAPPVIGFLYGGWTAALGAFLIAGVTRIVCLHHVTFCINSLCHWIGDRPYSTHCSARDSIIMALVTFGEGYHNYHHEFQYDYRNGVKPWQFDPTKWIIWTCHKIGLVKNLRRVPEEKILKAQITEHQRALEEKLSASSVTLTESLTQMLHNAQTSMNEALTSWETKLVEYREAIRHRNEISRASRRQLKRDLKQATQRLREAFEHWQQTHEIVSTQALAI